VSGRAEFFLGIIAFATLATAIVQIGVLVAAGLLVRRAQRLVVQIEHDIRPIFEHVNAIARDASRMASLATVQVERVDRLVADVIQRLEQTLSALQSLVTGPLTDGATLFTGVQSILSLIRDLRAGRRRRTRADDEDALFI
jgi:hypothetical protein